MYQQMKIQALTKVKESMNESLNDTDVYNDDKSTDV